MIERMLLEYLVNSVWQVPLVALGAWVVVRAGRPGPRIQHRIWVAALGLAVLLPGLTMRAPAEQGLEGVAASHAGQVPHMAHARRAVPGDVPDDLSTTVVAQRKEPVAAARAWDGLRRVWTRLREVTLGARTTWWMVRLYLAVLGWYGARLLASWWAARRMVLQAALTRLEGAEEELLERCCARVGVRRPQVRVSRATASPLVVGIWRPVLLLPEAFARGAQHGRELEAVLWHELLHVRRRDYLANLLCRLGMLPLAYHPAAYAIGRRIRQTREMVCDGTAAEAMESPMGYAQCLVGMARRMQLETASSAGMGMDLFGGGVLEERVMELIGTKANVSGRGRVLRGAACVAVCGVVAASVAAFHVTPTLAEPRAEAAVQEPLAPVAAATVVAPAAAVNPTGPASESAAPQPAQVAAPAAPPQPSLFPAPVALSRDQTEMAIRMTEAQQQFQMEQKRLQSQLEELRKQLNSPERRAQFAHLQKELEGLNTPESQKQIGEALQQLNSPEFQKQLRDATDQTTQQQNSAEVQRAVAEATAQALVGSQEFQQQMAEEMARAQRVLASAEIQRQIAEVNSPGFARQMQTVGRLKHTMEMQQQVYDNYRLELGKTLGTPDLWKSRDFQEQMSDLKQHLYVGNDTIADLTEQIQEASVSPAPDAEARLAGQVAAHKAASDQELLQAGMDAMQKGKYDVARARLQSLLTVYPNSKYAEEAKRAIAQSWDAQGTVALVHAGEAYAAAGIQPKKLGPGVTPPQLIYTVNPDYTPEARKAKFMGIVLVNMWVDEQGNVQHARVVRGVGMGLDEKAIEAVKQYKFKPAMENGKPVMVELNVEVNFKIF